MKLTRIDSRDHIELRLDHRPTREFETRTTQTTRKLVFRFFPSRLLICGVGQHRDADTRAPYLLDTDIDLTEGQRNTDETCAPRLLSIVSTTIAFRVIKAFFRWILMQRDPPTAKPVGRGKDERKHRSAATTGGRGSALKTDEIIER